MNGIYNGVISYCNTKELDKNSIPNFIESIYTGEKWQCIEFVRRFCILYYGITFENIKNVYELPSLDYFYCLKGHPIPIFHLSYKIHLPSINDIVVFRDGVHGHVGIVSHYDHKKKIIYIVDQNESYGHYWKTPYYSWVCKKDDPSIIDVIRI